MKLVSYLCDGNVRGGFLVDDVIYDLERLLLHTSWGDQEALVGVRDLLQCHGSALRSLSGDVDGLAAVTPDASVGDRANVRLTGPVTSPSKVLCVGLNYLDHVAETGRSLPEYPDVFAKFASTLIGPDDDIGGSALTDNLDFEGEVAVVIGRTGRRIAEADALDHVAGLVPLNDVTARDLQYRGTQWLAGKAVDGSTPWGPALVTLDEVGDPQNLELVTRVNGEELQRSNTRHQIFTIARIIAYVSSFLTLEPGDVVATGTPQGIGAKRTPPVWLRPGDTVEIEIERVGTLRSRVGDA